jgi:cytoskeletal protein CcmA (bactofilin family)/uncharacterized coiled-coil DUF342 family protein
MTTAKEPAIQENLRAETPEMAGRPLPEPNGRKPRFLARFRREREDALDVTGYVVDGLNTPKSVVIKTGATILGHVVAPKVVVEGTVLGSAYGREIEVASGGHISGDVFAIAVRIQPGGKIQGWVSSIDEADFERFRTTGTLIDEARLASQVETLGEKVDASILTRNESDMESLHLLQLELAATLAARYEMEQDFEKRLAEMAGEAFGKINSLTEQLTAVRGELTGQKRRLDETQETIRQQKTQIERQTNELSLSRDLMTDQNQELGELRTLYNDLRHRHQLLQTEKTEEDEVLQTAVTEKETLTKRLESLETAHRNNLQYQADQEDSLLRWQELAEMTERKAAELETKLQRAQFQIEESSTTINLLRVQRRELDAELEQALADLRELQGNKTRPLADPDVLIEATNRISQLESELADAEQEYLEQIIWYKASLETSRSELEKAREAAREVATSHSAEIQKLQDELAGLQTEMKRQQEQMATLQKETAVQHQEALRWQTAVTEKETEWRQQTNELQQTIVMLTADKKNMQATLRESQLQLSATENEVNRYLQETKSQGERLAEIHARLVEREIQLKQIAGQLKQAREMIEKQNQAIKQMKEMAGEKIRALQAENVRLKGRNP